VLLGLHNLGRVFVGLLLLVPLHTGVERPLLRVFAGFVHAVGTAGIRVLVGVSTPLGHPRVIGS
jgi:hypothetical protein